MSEGKCEDKRQFNPGRPRKKDGEKSEIVMMRVSDEEYKYLKFKAKQRGITLIEFCKRTLGL